jgi:chromosomal replication initiation ATPase DnaA
MLTYQVGQIPGFGTPMRTVPEGPHGKAYFTQTLAAVASSHGVSPADILGPFRFKALVHARQEVAWRMRNAKDALGKPRFSLPQIAAWMDRDHTTILHAVRAHEARTGRVGA